MELVLRDKRIQQLQSDLDHLSTECNQQKMDLSAFERQCSSKTCHYILFTNIS